MKLRSTRNSIRIRVRKSELVKLEIEREIVESIRFSQDVFLSFGLKYATDDQLGADFDGQQLWVNIPKATLEQWINSKQVGIETHLPNGEEGQLHILIEKDFPCLDREEEDYMDTFFELADAKDQSNC